MELKSQMLRQVNFQGDGLRMGTLWDEKDLAKPQILIDSAFGDSHPGSKHLDKLVEAARISVYEHQGKPICYTVTDICDGMAMAHDGMNYSLVSRDIMAYMYEIHALATPIDGAIFIASCDKSIPAQLMAMLRVNMPAIQVPGGSMLSGPDYMSSEILYGCGDQVLTGKMGLKELGYYTRNCCPSAGACQFMGTASTMQCMSEAMGLALPGNALVPAYSNLIVRYARQAGRQLMELVRQNLRPRDIVTHKNIENAIIVHAAISGSTNALLHLPAIAKEAGIKIDPDLFDRLNRKIPVLVSLKTGGQWPTELFWYAGGVPAIMRELKDFLHLDALTVTGKTVGENLRELEKSGFFTEINSYLINYNLTPDAIIKTCNNPVKPQGNIVILKGNLAPAGAVVKTSGLAPEMYCFTGRARVFNSEEDAVAALLADQIVPGDVIIIRFEGPQGSGMPEMLRMTEALYTRPELAQQVLLITDGRFSGATRGPAVGHVTPEAYTGGPLAYVKDGDLIRMDIPARRLDVIGTEGQVKDPAEIEAVLVERSKNAVLPQKESTGVLSLYRRLATSVAGGATIG
ncbi:dihydroxy-acid dehydratase [Desulfofundulus thermosubterraneus]|uniref:Dihydroxy-acid dehydratase n=1 Tax=Desulfofundulus thermosubterraneus DSM 16057 TaxID=1121432 RepID=A0A1M6C1L3_9FIRM|nr:dihydroxy-acid dehydratase [Desulfofundulus thermosubterraneus]SHI54721.1 dihydroxy-acid dehydratase [Desulfofundulus thermosubterraneus DSM 16057]